MNRAMLYRPFNVPRYVGAMGYVGATLDETYLKDTLAKKLDAETLYNIANPLWTAAFADKKGYATASKAVAATIDAYEAARVSAQAVLGLPPSLPEAASAKEWATKYISDFTARIGALNSVAAELASQDATRSDADRRAEEMGNLASGVGVVAVLVGAAYLAWRVLLRRAG